MRDALLQLLTAAFGTKPKYRKLIGVSAHEGIRPRPNPVMSRSQIPQPIVAEHQLQLPAPLSYACKIGKKLRSASRDAAAAHHPHIAKPEAAEVIVPVIGSGFKHCAQKSGLLACGMGKRP